MTDQTDDQGVDWGDVAPDGRTNWEAETTAVAAELPRLKYPDYPDNPHNHRFTISLTPGKAPMVVVRGNTAAEMTAAFQELEEYGVYANLAAADASLKAQGQLGAGLGPVTPVGPQAPPPGPAGPASWQTPQTPPPFGPNVSVPSAPGYVGPPQQYPSAPAPQGWNGGGGGGGNFQGRAEPKPQPPGWYRLNARSGPGFDAWKQLREQQKDYVKGKVAWGGKSDYWIEPSLAQWLAGLGFAVTP